MKDFIEEIEDTLDYIVLNKIQNASRTLPIKLKRLCDEINISPRIAKRIITKLRKEYPIVSKETNGGGYWMATTPEEVNDFISMINARKFGYEETINTMKKHLRKTF